MARRCGAAAAVRPRASGCGWASTSLTAAAPARSGSGRARRSSQPALARAAPGRITPGSPAEASMDHPVRMVTTVPTPTAVVAMGTSWSDFPTLWRVLLAEVWTFLRDSGLTTGRNVMLYEDDTPHVQ